MKFSEKLKRSLKRLKAFAVDVLQYTVATLIILVPSLMLSLTILKRL